MKKLSLGQLLREVHEDQRGAVSLETILIIGAVAVPVLIFLVKFAWPQIRNYFQKGMQDLQEGSDAAAQGNT
jgi:F0F1-type ATP synthase membrane subunit b/b'